MASPWTQTLSTLYPAAPRVQSQFKSLASGSKRQATTPGAPAPALSTTGSSWGQSAATVGSSPLTSMAASPAPMASNQANYTSTPGSTNAIDPFWRPGNGYGGEKDGKRQDWWDTEIGENFGENQPQGEYLRFLSRNGATGQDRFSQWARSMYSQARSGYDAARASNPELRWRAYLKTIDGRLQDLYASMSAQDRGVNVPTQVKTIYQG